MITLAKSLIGLSALIAVGTLSTGTLNDARPRPTSASTFADRFVFTIESQGPTGEGIDLTEARRNAAAALAAITLPMDTFARKGDRLDVLDGAPTEGTVRYVTIQRQTGPATSDAARTPMVGFASR
jgi:hypothetical protein